MKAPSHRIRLLAHPRSGDHTCMICLYLFIYLLLFIFSPYIWRKSDSKVLVFQPFGQLQLMTQEVIIFAYSHPPPYGLKGGKWEVWMEGIASN